MLLEALDDVLSVQLRARFVFDAGLVAAGMVASIVCALVLAAFLAIAQLLAAARLPIMKLQETKQPPQLPLPQGLVWHLFLCAAICAAPPFVALVLTVQRRGRSHIWGTGQDVCATIKRQLLLLLTGVAVFLDVDDLADIASLETYIEQSAVIMIFVSKG